MVLKTYEMDEATNRVRISLNVAVQANEKEHVNLGLEKGHLVSLVDRVWNGIDRQ